MKKRLRKKLHLGEFTDLCFTLNGKLKPMTEEEEDAFFETFFELAASAGFALEGTIGGDGFDLEVITGPADTSNDMRREAFLAAIKELEAITEFDASTLA